MERLQSVLRSYGRWQGLDIYPKRIETFIESDFTLAIENGKSLIESICKTILDEQNEAVASTEKLHKLVQKTLELLGIFGKKQISKFGSGFITSVQQLGEFRNRIGDTSHGRTLQEIKLNKLESLSTEFLINAIETMACFLIEYYENQFLNNNEEKKIKYEDYQDFNDYLDEESEYVFVADNAFLPSEVLFNMDEVAYKAEYQKFIEIYIDVLEKKLNEKT